MTANDQDDFSGVVVCELGSDLGEVIRAALRAYNAANPGKTVREFRETAPDRFKGATDEQVQMVGEMRYLVGVATAWIIGITPDANVRVDLINECLNLMTGIVNADFERTMAASAQMGEPAGRA